MKTDEQIIAEFAREFDCPYDRAGCGECELIEKFILNALKEQREELVREIEGMRIEYCDDENCDCENDSVITSEQANYNLTLDDVLNFLKK